MLVVADRCIRLAGGGETPVSFELSRLLMLGLLVMIQDAERCVNVDQNEW